MNDQAKHVIDSLAKARAHVYEACSNEKVDSEEDIDAVWEGYLTLVAALYSQDNYTLAHIGLAPWEQEETK